jgi:26S proteasome regulatory subunit N9
VDLSRHFSLLASSLLVGQLAELYLQITVLDDSPYGWLHEMLECFNHGDMHRYDELCTKYASVLNAQPALVENERKLREKITILCLMETIFK